MSTVAEVRAGIAAVVAKIGDLQSALGVAKDRADSTYAMLKPLAEGTGQDHAGVALAMTISVNEQIDTMIGETLAAVEALQAWDAGL